MPPFNILTAHYTSGGYAGVPVLFLQAITSSSTHFLISSIGKSQERAVASLFSPGGTHAMKGEFAGINDFEVVAFVVILPDGETPA